MSNPWDELRAALSQARELERATENYAFQMGRMLRGKLHHCSNDDVAALKRELADYNIHTGKWRNKP